MTTLQPQQGEWVEQWAMFQDEELFLFRDWIAPATPESFQGLTVLEGGCGGGQHTRMMAPYAKSVTAVDLNTTAIARKRNASLSNVEFIEADLASMDLQRRFDVVLSIGVVHHTHDPDRTVANLIRHLKPGGRLILWVYSKEGNALVEYGVEPLRRGFLRKLSRISLLRLSQIITAVLYPIVYTIYLLPAPFLPYYAYFKNFRRLTFTRNVLNVFDKLNAPQVQFITRERAQAWFDPRRFEETHLSSYCGVSWRASGRLKREDL